MDVSKERLNRCSLDGNRFEDLFMEKVISIGLKFKKGKKKDD